VEREPALRALVEASCRRIGALKQRCLKEFTGAPENALEARLKSLNHQRIIAEIHGSL
jgi:hypothetical protein